MHFEHDEIPDYKPYLTPVMPYIIVFIILVAIVIYLGRMFAVVIR
jgi:hypothetical protein